MPLTLEVIGQKAAQMGAGVRKVFHGGETIGRLNDNDWVFPDQYISGRHAKISFAAGSYLIEDTSTNGVFINSPQNRIPRGQPQPLHDGDTVFIDDYEVRVTVEADYAAAEPSGGPRNPQTVRQPHISAGAHFGGKRQAGSPAAATPPSLLTQPLEFPSDAIAGDLTPDDYDPLDEDDVMAPARESARAGHPPPPGSVGPVRSANRSAFPARPALRSRSQSVVAPSTVRYVRTQRDAPSAARTTAPFPEAPNHSSPSAAGEPRSARAGSTAGDLDKNPLRVSANVDDALHDILLRCKATYPGPKDAFEDAFQDVRDHQMAILAGMCVAYDDMLAKFDPQRLQKDFDEQMKAKSFSSGSAEQRYWELYCGRFRDMAKDADSCFRHLFGDEFSKAYREELARLKTLNRRYRQ